FLRRVFRRSQRDDLRRRDEAVISENHAPSKREFVATLLFAPPNIEQANDGGRMVLVTAFELRTPQFGRPLQPRRPPRRCKSYLYTRRRRSCRRHLPSHCGVGGVAQHRTVIPGRGRWRPRNPRAPQVEAWNEPERGRRAHSKPSLLLGPLDRFSPLS